jgi:four helix bundle protein
MRQRKSIESYRDLEVWQRGIDLVEQTYQITDHFPAQEKYGLTAQLRRAVVSISSNIAEGWGYSSRKQYIHFLEQARSSLLEVETQFIIAERLGYITASALEGMLRETTTESKMLLSLMRALRR